MKAISVAEKRLFELNYCGRSGQDGAVPDDLTEIDLPLAFVFDKNLAIGVTLKC